jgi:hypothetical protein
MDMRPQQQQLRPKITAARLRVWGSSRTPVVCIALCLLLLTPRLQAISGTGHAVQRLLQHQPDTMTGARHQASRHCPQCAVSSLLAVSIASAGVEGACGMGDVNSVGGECPWEQIYRCCLPSCCSVVARTRTLSSPATTCVIIYIALVSRLLPPCTCGTEVDGHRFGARKNPV